MSSHGVILGAIFCGLATGETIGPLITGYIFDITGNYNPAFLVSATLSIIAIILVLFLRPITDGSIDKSTISI